MDPSIVLGADPSPLAALLLGSHTGNMLPPRALRHRGGAARHRSSTAAGCIVMTHHLAESLTVRPRLGEEHGGSYPLAGVDQAFSG
jgi:hypothetical protein